MSLAVISQEPVDRRTGRRPAWTVLLVTLVVSLPLIVALVDLRSQRWYPALDLSMTEFRVRDVGDDRTPLIGLPGRIGLYPDQGSHPGPLSFYLLAPIYRLLGSTSWALQVASVSIHVAAVATALWIGQRRAGWRGVAAVGALLAVVIRGYGQILLTQPWNPYLPLLAWIVVLLAAWAVACGDSVMLVPMVVAGTLCAQTHVPYLVACGASTIGALVFTAWRSRRPEHGGLPLRRHVVVAVGVGVALWIPPLIDQVINEPGNVGKLLDHFGSPPENALGVPDGIRLAFRHLDIWGGFIGQFVETGRFISPASTGRGVVLLAVWLVAAGYAWRSGPPALRALNTVVGAALVLGAVSMARIFGLPWFYLTLWAWGTSAVALGAVVWTAFVGWTAISGRPATRVLPALSAAVLGAATAASVASFADAEVPEERVSTAIAGVAGPTYDAVVDGVGAASGADGQYQVRWSDAADIGSPGFGLLNELERRGLDVAADEYFHVPVTDYRARPREDADAQIHVATGGYVDVWRDVPLAVEVATYEPRDAGELARYYQTRRRLVDRLAAERLDDVAQIVDTNLFGGSLDPRLSPADIADFTALLELGQPMSVFIAPATADPAPTP